MPERFRVQLTAKSVPLAACSTPTSQTSSSWTSQKRKCNKSTHDGERFLSAPLESRGLTALLVVCQPNRACGAFAGGSGLFCLTYHEARAHMNFLVVGYVACCILVLLLYYNERVLVAQTGKWENQQKIRVERTI